MSALDQIISVQITPTAPVVSAQSFSIVLVLGASNPNWSNGDKVRTYSSPDGLLADGYTTTSPEYINVAAMYAQAIAPSAVKVAPRTAGAAQVDSFVVNTLTAGHVYTLKVNGTTCSYTAQASDTQTAVLNALSTQAMAAGGLSGSVSGTGAAAALALTATTSGTTVSYSAIDSLLTRTTVTAASGIAQDLAAVAAVDNTFYGIVCPGASDADILQVAAWAESNKKVYWASSTTAAIATSTTSDVFSQCTKAGYTKTFPLFRNVGKPQGAAACWASSILVAAPGSKSAAYKQLAGITADTLTDSQRAILIGNPVAGVPGKNVNIYTSVGGVNVTQMGINAVGTPIDIVIGTDWLTSTLQTDIYQALVSMDKVPYTDAGMAVLLNVVIARLTLASQSGFLDGTSIQTSVASVASVSPTTRAQRISPPIVFSARVQGAISSVIIKGTITV